MIKDLQFDEKKHTYSLDGQKMKSCTTILGIISKPALIGWAAGEVVKYIKENCEFVKDGDVAPWYVVTENELEKAKSAHRKKKEKAADWGTLVHKAIEIYIKTKAIPTAVEVGGENVVLSLEHMTSINNFVKWAEDNKVEFLESEKRIYSEEWMVAGTCDFVCKIDGKLYVGDLKTSSGIYEEYFLQTAAYGKMMMEMGLYDHFDHLVIVNCKKDGTIDTVIRKDVAGNIKCFEAALTLHNRLDIKKD